MTSLVWYMLVLCVWVVPAWAQVAGSGRYMWYRHMNVSARRVFGGKSARRVFGGKSARLGRFGAAGALLDRELQSHCSATVVAPRWALTAAHCLNSKVHYVQYNMQYPDDYDARHATAQQLYRHPEYEVKISNESNLPDVTLLHHDIGLVHTRSDMNLVIPTNDLLATIPLHKPAEFRNQEVEMLGFGRSEQIPMGEQLWSVRLTVEQCARKQWFHCACAWGEGRGVCAGDSGGPVLWRDALVGVTSMGPAKCDGGAAGDRWDSSVFTTLYPYAEILDNTIHDAQRSGIKMVAYQAAESHFRSSVGLLFFSICYSVVR